MPPCVSHISDAAVSVSLVSSVKIQSIELTLYYERYIFYKFGARIRKKSRFAVWASAPILHHYSLDGWMDGFIYADPSLSDMQPTSTIYIFVRTSIIYHFLNELRASSEPIMV